MIDGCAVVQGGVCGRVRELGDRMWRRGIGSRVWVWMQDLRYLW